MAIWALLGIGIAAGVAGGLFGIGGGILIVPALIFLGGFTQQRAQGTSLVALLAPVGIFGLINYYRAGQADMASGLWIALGFLGGAFLGSKVALALPPETMRRVFAGFLIVVALYMLFVPPNPSRSGRTTALQQSNDYPVSVS